MKSGRPIKTDQTVAYADKFEFQDTIEFQALCLFEGRLVLILIWYCITIKESKTYYVLLFYIYIYN